MLINSFLVEELLSYTLADLKDLDLLMHELSSTSYCNESILDEVIYDKNSHVYIIRKEDHIIAASTLCVIHTLEFTNASIESVVVSTKYRGQGFGRILVEHLIYEAKKMKVHSIYLTSNPKRIAANNLYKKLGFIKYETNCYVFDLK